MENKTQNTEAQDKRVFGVFTLPNGEKKHGELVRLDMPDMDVFVAWFYDLNYAFSDYTDFTVDEEETATEEAPAQEETTAAPQTEEVPAQKSENIVKDENLTEDAKG